MIGSSVTPPDYGALLRSGAAVVPDLAEQMVRQQLAAAQGLNARTNAAQEERLLGADQRGQRRQTEFSERFNLWSQNPTMQGMTQLMAAYPEFHEQARRAYEITDTRDREINRRQISEAFSALAGDQRDIAASVIRRRRDADLAAGEDVDDYDRMLELIESDDPQDHRRARAMLAYELAATLGEAHFSAGLDRLLETVAPPDWERYAQSQGLQPGTPEYRDAMRDYVLRGSGPTAHGYDVDMENYRQGNREDLEQRRQTNRLAVEDRREQARRNRPRKTNVLERIREKIAAGQPLSPGEQRVWDQASARGRPETRGLPAGRAAQPSPASSSAPSGAEATAVGPGGQRIFLRGGRWVDAQGRPAGSQGR